MNRSRHRTLRPSIRKQTSTAGRQPAGPRLGGAVRSRPGSAPLPGLPLLHDLEPGLVPLAQFSSRRWLYASPSWYYHRPAPIPPLRIDRCFYELMDPDLRPLCSMLHGAGVATAPSCQGHFHRMRYFRDVWDELQSQRDAIRHGGLTVRDSETEIAYRFHDPRYQLPWRGFDDFYSDVAAQQQGGYIGVRVPLQRWRLWGRLLREVHGQSHARFTAALAPMGEAYTLHIHVRAPSPELQTRAWSDVTRHLRAVLRQIDTTDHHTPGLFLA